MAYYIPPPEKVEGRVLRVPHQIAPMTTWSWKCSNMPKTALYFLSVLRHLNSSSKDISKHSYF